MKNICFVTSTRADYGLQYSIMNKVKSSSKLNLQLIVTGSHLSENFGNTYQNILDDGFEIDYKISLGELTDSKVSTLNQMGTALFGFAQAFESLKPDLIVILGDRYEIMCAAQSAFIFKIPILHIHGGEVTEGAFDDIIRHTITKMSSYHFTAAEPYKKRVIQMGEYPEHVFNIGAVGLELLNNIDYVDKDTLARDINFELKDKNVLITYHPVTMSNEDGIKELIEALKEYQNIGQLITFPNSDPGFNKIQELLEIYAKNNSNVLLVKSLGSLNYLRAMKLVDIVIGNSSSGIIEAPYLGTPTVNIGDRQTGRIRANTIIDCIPQANEIKSAIEKALKMKRTKSNIHGDGNCSDKILKFLENTDFELKRGFYDL